MQTSINLQGSFMYPFISVIFVIGLIVAITSYVVYLIITKRKEVKVEDTKVKEIPEKNIKNIPVIKSKYLQQLYSIEIDYSNGKCKLRKAYQLISEAIRMFVFEITDITTQNYSLAEIKKLGIPSLYELIEEFYEPEFASKSQGDFDSSIAKARRVINEWK